jgi:hypothetical protein
LGTQISVLGEPIEQKWEAVVTRCGCGDAQLYHEKRYDEAGNVVGLMPCPKPSAVIDYGIISYHHKNPILDMIGQIRSKLDRRKAEQAEKRTGK